MGQLTWTNSHTSLTAAHCMQLLHSTAIQHPPYPVFLSALLQRDNIQLPRSIRSISRIRGIPYSNLRETIITWHFTTYNQLASRILGDSTLPLHSCLEAARTRRYTRYWSIFQDDSGQSLMYPRRFFKNNWTIFHCWPNEDYTTLSTLGDERHKQRWIQTFLIPRMCAVMHAAQSLHVCGLHVWGFTATCVNVTQLFGKRSQVLESVTVDKAGTSPPWGRTNAALWLSTPVHEKLTKIFTDIQLKIEEEHEGKLAFLDVYVGQTGQRLNTNRTAEEKTQIHDWPNTSTKKDTR